MVQDGQVVHHFHKKRCINQKDVFSHSKKFWKKRMDKIIYPIGIFGPIMTLPQLTKIWIHKNAAGISAISWIAYTICAVFWLMYGIIHKEKPIIFTYSIWIFLDVIIVFGTFIYG